MKMRSINQPPPTSYSKINVGGGSVGRRTDVPNVTSAPRPKDKPQFSIDIEKEDQWPPFVGLDELLADGQQNEAEQREAEWSYRDGYLAGWTHCVRAIERLARKGYVRAKDIASLLADHDNALRLWRDAALEEAVLGFGEPKFTRPSWANLRDQIFDRDGRQCRQCGSRRNLEAHHVEPVAEGGLSVAGNLLTLCRKCHRGF